MKLLAIVFAAIVTGTAFLTLPSADARPPTAAERVTIFARPTVLSGTTLSTVFGSIDSGKAGEDVTIQTKDCGQQDFRAFAGTQTREGGGWSYPVSPGINTTVRAVWRGASSAQIPLRQRVRVYLEKLRSRKGLRVGVLAKKSFWRKRAQIQRLDGTSRTWKNLKTLRMTESGSAGIYSSASAELTVTVPKGTVLRALVPLSQARPCYLAGTSKTVRT
jgi:hypothetical protein